MFSTEDFINMARHGRVSRPCLAIIAVFCCVDDLWNQLTQGRKIRKGGFAPSVSDSEIITMEIVGEFLGIETDKGIWHYFRDNWGSLFPLIENFWLIMEDTHSEVSSESRVVRLLCG